MWLQKLTGTHPNAEISRSTQSDHIGCDFTKILLDLVIWFFPALLRVVCERVAVMGVARARFYLLRGCWMHSDVCVVLALRPTEVVVLWKECFECASVTGFRLLHFCVTWACELRLRFCVLKHILSYKQMGSNRNKDWCTNQNCVTNRKVQTVIHILSFRTWAIEKWYEW